MVAKIHLVISEKTAKPRRGVAYKIKGVSFFCALRKEPWLFVVFRFEEELAKIPDIFGAKFTTQNPAFVA